MRLLVSASHLGTTLQLIACSRCGTRLGMNVDSIHDTADLIAALQPYLPRPIACPRPASQGPMLGVAAVVDGIQQTKTLTHRAGRPVVLAFLAAGAVDPATGTLLAIEERLTLHCATQDVGWLADVTNSTVPIEHTPATHFREVEDDIAAAIGDKRMRLEARLVRRLLTDAPDTQHVVVDGSLAPHARDRRVVGLVKTTDTTYLACEHQLLSLPEGRTTPAFRTDHAHSSYLRLHHNHRRSWAHGLVRLETHDPSLLDQFASWAMSQRQPPTTKDPRGDRHLSPVAVCEAWLRSRTPAVLTLDLDQ